MAVYGGPDIVTDGLVLHLDAANDKSYDPVVEDCSLVLNMEGSNGSTTFTDGSKYGHTVTANGNAQISTGNSRFGASSAYFDGNGDYLFISNNSVFNLESSDFTIEANVFLTGYAQNNQGYYQSMIFCKDDFGLRSYTLQIGGTANSWTSVNFTLFVTNTNVVGYTASFNFQLNRWYHIAVVRKGQSIRIYVDGIDIGGGTAVNPQTTSANLHIGGYGAASGFNSYGYYYNHPGYIDSLRVVKGKALYTENFTPPKKSFPEYKWGDLSGNDNNGTFFNGVAYSSSNYGVMSFDGVNDYVTLGDNKLKYQDNFTLEAFCRFPNLPDNPGSVCGARYPIVYNHDYGYNLLVRDDGKVTWNVYNTASSNIGTFSINSIIGSNYFHLVGIKSGTTCSLYVNGIFQSSANLTTNAVYYINEPFVIGGFGLCGPNRFYSTGNIVSIKVYNRSLTVSQIQQNYNATKGRYGL